MTHLAEFPSKIDSLEQFYHINFRERKMLCIRRMSYQTVKNVVWSDFVDL